LLLGALALGVATTAPAAGAQINWTTCAGTIEFACAHVPVPLDRSGTGPSGTIELSVRRRRAPVGDESDAIVALAGGPGQAVLPLAHGLLELLGPVLADHDLLIFDQRGTGQSGALKCAALDHYKGLQSPPPSRVSRCAAQIGPSVADYSTLASVADLETLREQAGYQKLILYATSYGTLVALDYARLYPSHVEALVLDSTLPPSGEDPFGLSTYGAMRRILGQLCANHACRGITDNPVANLQRLDARVRVHPLRAVVYNGHGIGHRVRIREGDLFDVLLDGDFDLPLRAPFPAAVRSALAGDNQPMAALNAAANASGAGSDADIDVALFYATSCQDTPGPWTATTTSPAARLIQATAAAKALPTNSFAPFDVSTAVDEGPAMCTGWPTVPPAAAPTAPLPNVPTLIFSGAEDTRTPTANARAVASQIPDARLIVVPNTGHSVLGTSPTVCPGNALDAFLSVKPVKPCPAEPPPEVNRPTAIDPAHLRDLRPVADLPPLVGRTVTAAVQTFGYVVEGFASAFASLLSGESSNNPTNAGGLRGGWADLTPGGTLHLHGFSFVGGVNVSGSVALASDTVVGTLRVGGRAAAHGTLVLEADGGVHGFLDGVYVQVPAGRLDVVLRMRQALLQRAAELRLEATNRLF
jgi:pimeloyl-ACP methyl ester carboxylesterase